MIVSVINVVNECSQSMRDSYHACSNADVSNLALTDRIRKKLPAQLVCKAVSRWCCSVFRCDSKLSEQSGNGWFEIVE